MGFRACRCGRASEPSRGTGVAGASHPMTTHGTHRAGTGRSTAGRQRSFAEPASHPRIDRRAGARGQVMVLTAIGMIALCAVAGLAGDTGYFFDYRRRMQTAADAAALAGAEQLRRDNKIASAAQAAAATDGFTNAADVAVHNP